MRSLPGLTVIALMALQLASGASHAQSASKAPTGGRANPGAAPAALTPAELAIAVHVHVGRLPCELGQFVDLSADPMAIGYFRLVLGKSSYRLAPQETTTGAIRLEDKAAGIVWLQLANKSMLMDQKQGRRVADDCKSPAQARVAQALLANPAPSVLDAPAPAPQKLAGE